MILWLRQIQTLRPMDSLPLLQTVASELRTNTSYHYEGRNRPHETQCVFKYTISGEGVFRDGSGEHRVPAEHGFLVKISTPETAYYYPEDASDPWHFTYVSFQGETADAMVNEIVKRHGSVFKLGRQEEIIQRMQELRSWDEDRCIITASWGGRFVNDLLTALIESRELSTHQDPGQELVRRVRNAVADHIQENITVQHLAQHLNMSREYLARKFKEETGVSPHKFLVRQKMLAACNLLKDTTQSNKEISAWLGYDEPAHFARTFKRTLGITPTQFRLRGHLPPA